MKVEGINFSLRQNFWLTSWTFFITKRKKVFVQLIVKFEV